LVLVVMMGLLAQVQPHVLRMTGAMRVRATVQALVVGCGVPTAPIMQSQHHHRPDQALVLVVMMGLLAQVQPHVLQTTGAMRVRATVQALVVGCGVPTPRQHRVQRQSRRQHHPHQVLVLVVMMGLLAQVQRHVLRMTGAMRVRAIVQALVVGCGVPTTPIMSERSVAFLPHPYDDVTFSLDGLGQLQSHCKHYKRCVSEWYIDHSALVDCDASMCVVETCHVC